MILNGSQMRGNGILKNDNIVFLLLLTCPQNDYCMIAQKAESSVGMTVYC